MKFFTNLNGVIVNQENVVEVRRPKLVRGKVEEDFEEFETCYTEESVDFIWTVIENATITDDGSDQGKLSLRRKPKKNTINDTEENRVGTTAFIQDARDKNTFYVPLDKDITKHRIWDEGNGDDPILVKFGSNGGENTPYKKIFTVNQVLDLVEQDGFLMSRLMMNDDAKKLKHELSSRHDVLCVDHNGLDFARDDRKWDVNRLIVVKVPPPEEEPVATLLDLSDLTKEQATVALENRRLAIEERKLALEEEKAAQAAYLADREASRKELNDQRLYQMDRQKEMNSAYKEKKVRDDGRAKADDEELFAYMDRLGFTQDGKGGAPITTPVRPIRPFNVRSSARGSARRNLITKNGESPSDNHHQRQREVFGTPPQKTEDDASVSPKRKTPPGGWFSWN